MRGKCTLSLPFGWEQAAATSRQTAFLRRCAHFLPHAKKEHRLGHDTINRHATAGAHSYSTFTEYIHTIHTYIYSYIHTWRCRIESVQHACTECRHSAGTNTREHIQTYDTVQCNAMQCNTIQYNTVQYSTVQYSTVQYSTVQYNTIQYNTIQYNTVQYMAFSLLYALFEDTMDNPKQQKPTRLFQHDRNS